MILPRLNLESPPAGDEPLGTIVRRAMFPRPAWLWLFHVLIVVNALGWWAYMHWTHPAEPLSVLTIYRSGDLEYFPLIDGLARGNVGESGVRGEQFGSGVVSIPLVAVSIHAGCVRLFGETGGFIVCELVVTLLFYWLGIVFFRLLGAGPVLAAAGGAMLATHFFTAIATQLESRLHLPPGALPLELWGARIPRPFVTELFLLASLCCLLQIVRSRQTATHPAAWAALGAATGLLLQGDVFRASVIGAAGGLAGIGLFIFDRQDRRRLTGCAAACAAAAGIALIPFVLQRLHELPDVGPRLGVMVVPRLLWQINLGNQIGWLLALVIVGGAAIGLQRCVWIGPAAARKNREVGLFLLTAAIALAAPQIDALIFGKLAQPYHFIDCFRRFFSYGLLVVGLALFEMALAVLRARRPARDGASSWVRNHLEEIIGCSALLLMSVLLVKSHPTYETLPMRHDFDRYKFPKDGADAEDVTPAGGQLESSKAAARQNELNYRQAFVELVNELSQPKYARDAQLVTFDHQVHVWWRLYHADREQPGYVFNPDPTTSPLADREVERRLAVACKLLGMQRPEQFIKFLSDNAIDMLYLAGGKYEANSFHTFGERGLDQYSEAMRPDIAATPWTATFHLRLPTDEVSRLEQLFRDTDPNVDVKHIDVIVLTVRDLQDGFAPPPELFEPVPLKNGIFRVWVRKP